MGRDDSCLVVEVVYATPGPQVLCRVTLPRGSTIQDAIERAGIARRLTTIDVASCKVGVFGKLSARDALVKDGDRVELYRSLIVDPKAARRIRSRRTLPARDSS